MGKLVSGFLGMDNGMKAGKAAAAAGERFAKDIYFKPYTLTSGFGATQYEPTGTYQSQLASPFYNAQIAALSGATNLLGDLAGFNPQARQADIYQQQSALLQPEFQAQNIAMQEQMFGSGRLGLKLAGAGVGAGSGGAVSPDAYGLARAQQQTLADLAVKSREQALQEGATLADMSTALLAQGIGIAELEATLIKLGVDAESARAAAAAAAGQVGTGGYQTMAQAGMAQDRAMGSLFGGIAGGLLGGAGTAAAGGATGGLAGIFGSDENLKTDIKVVGKLDNGLNLYTWKWNSKAKELGINQPTIGVIAQEVQKIMPEAVIERNGYLAVNYDMVMR